MYKADSAQGKASGRGGRRPGAGRPKGTTGPTGPTGPNKPDELKMVTRSVCLLPSQWAVVDAAAASLGCGRSEALRYIVESFGR